MVIVKEIIRVFEITECIFLSFYIVDEIKELKAANSAEKLVREERENNRILTEKLHEK